MGKYNTPLFTLQRNLHMTRYLYDSSTGTTVTNSNNATLNVHPMATNNDESYFAQNDDTVYQELRSKTFKGETFKNQAKLPDLPIPDLKQSLQNYLNTVKPYTEDISQQVELVNDFANGMGPILQDRLINYSKGKRNWLSKWWDSQAYLNYSDPVIPYVSYFYNHKPLSHSIIEENYLFKSTAIINSVIKFLESIKDQSLPPEMIKGNPFCMNSFKLMFNNSRVPNVYNKKLGNDTTVDTNHFYSIYENNFMIVMVGGNFYKLFTHRLNNSTKIFEPLSTSEIYNQLQQIVIDSQSIQQQPNTEIGILTSLPRDKWKKAYWELIKDPSSKLAMEQIHKSSFILCLDLDQSPITLVEKSRNSWHGNGINRFYDKPLQFFVCANGKSGFLAEHSKMDGTPTLFLNNFICKDISNLNEKDFINSILNNTNANTKITYEKPQRIQFNIPPFLKNEIKLAKYQFNSTINEHDLNIWHYQKYGKGLMKKFGFSPDAYIQQIMQLAIFKYLGKQLPTYEAASTRKFFKGRTEAVRSVSMESKNFVTNWCDPTVPISDKLKLFRESIAAHVDYLKRSSNGQGIDRHFFGLKQMLKKDEPIPNLLKDPIFNYSSNWLISTSQLSSEYFDGYGWSQVNDNGFGLAYMINNDWLHINIVNKPGKSGLDGKKLQYYLTEAADEIADALQNESIKAKL